jgi:TorA maturation chaperone TorD
MSKILKQVSGCENALVRSQIYGFVAKLLSRPENLLDVSTFEEIHLVINESPGYTDLEKEIDQLKKTVLNLSLSSRDLKREYTALFLKSDAPPYECSYVPGSRLAQELADISGFFLAFGLRSHQDRQDHLVSELEFMALLCLKESIALGNQMNAEAKICRDAQVKFLQDHLGRWVGIYCGLISDKAKLPIYPKLVSIVHKILGQDASYLGIKLEEIVEVPKDDVRENSECGVEKTMVG